MKEIKHKFIKYTKGWKLVLIFMLLVSFTPSIINNIYYTFNPVEKFVDIQKLDFQDYKQGSKTQLLLSYRDSKVDTIWDFYYKIFCNWKTDILWNYNTPWIILPKTDWLKIIKVDMPALNLPKWECLIQAKVYFDIKWFKKETYLEDTFLVK